MKVYQSMEHENWNSRIYFGCALYSVFQSVYPLTLCSTVPVLLYYLIFTISLFINASDLENKNNEQSKKDGKVQERVQLSTTPDPGYRMGK